MPTYSSVSSARRADAPLGLEARDRVRADEHVLEHGHRREELDVLERARDAELDDAARRRVQERLAVEDDVARVEPVEPRDHVERRRLAGAVRADQAEDRAFLRPRARRRRARRCRRTAGRRSGARGDPCPAAADSTDSAPRASRYSCQSCSIVVVARRADVRRVVRRVVDGAHDERALGVDVEDVDAARAPARSRRGRCARRSSARLEDRAVDGAVQDEQDDVPARRRRAARRARAARGRAARRSSRRRGTRVERNDAAERGRSSSPAPSRVRRRGCSPLSISRSAWFASSSASGATMRAVSSVRGRPLVITRSKRTPRSASAAASAWLRPSSREQDVVRVLALEVAHLRVAHQVDAPAWRSRHCARSDWPPAACMPAIIPAGAAPSGKRSTSSASSASASHFSSDGEELARAPAAAAR